MSIRPFVTDSWYHQASQKTKARFHTVLAVATQARSPTKLIISGDASVADEIDCKNGTVELKFDRRAIVVANHQIYADWCFLWFCSYLANNHGAIHIVLKNAIKYIPLLGLGLVQWSFIFLSRNWKKDEKKLELKLGQLNKDRDQPMQLILFPEGTNYSKESLARSKAYAASRPRGGEVPSLSRTLLPRSRGLRKCILELRDSVTYLYDCTIAYDPLPPSGFPSTAYTLRSLYLDKRPPNAVHLHWRKIALSSIPIHDEEAFEKWLYERWTEKDDMLSAFYKTGRFPDAVVTEETQIGVTEEEEHEMRVYNKLTLGIFSMASSVSEAFKSSKRIARGSSSAK